MKPVRVVLAVVGAALAAGGAWLAFRPAAVAVETAMVARGPLRMTLIEQGETRAHDRFVVTAPAAGRVERIALHEGDAVAAGDTVAVLHVAPLSAAVREAQVARIAAAEAGVREATETMVRFGRLLACLEEGVTLFGFAVMCVFVAVQLFFRFALNSPLMFPEEISRYAYVWITLVGLSLATKPGSTSVWMQVLACCRRAGSGPLACSSTSPPPRSSSGWVTSGSASCFSVG